MTPEEQQELELLEEGIGRLARRAAGKVRHSVGGVRPWNWGKTNLEWKEHLYRRDRRGKFVDQNKADPPPAPRDTPFDQHVAPQRSADTDGDGFLGPKELTRLVAKVLRMRDGEHTPLHDLIAPINRLRELKELNDGAERAKIDSAVIWKTKDSLGRDQWEVRWRDSAGSSGGEAIKVSDLLDPETNEYDPNRLLPRILDALDKPDLHNPEVVGDWAPGFCDCGCGSTLARKEYDVDKKFLPGHENRVGVGEVGREARGNLDELGKRDKNLPGTEGVLVRDADTKAEAEAKKNFLDDLRSGRLFQPGGQSVTDQVMRRKKSTAFEDLQARLRGTDAQGRPRLPDFATQKEANAWIRRRWRTLLFGGDTPKQRRELEGWIKEWTEWANDISKMKDDKGNFLDPYDYDVQRKYDAPKPDPKNAAVLQGGAIGDKIGHVPHEVLVEAKRRTRETGKRHFIYFDPSRVKKRKNQDTGEEYVDWADPQNYVISDSWHAYDPKLEGKSWIMGRDGEVPNYNSHGLLMLRGIIGDDGEANFVYAVRQLLSKDYPNGNINRTRNDEALLNILSPLRNPIVVPRKGNRGDLVDPDVEKFNDLIEKAVGQGFIGEDEHAAARLIGNSGGALNQVLGRNKADEARKGAAKGPTERQQAQARVEGLAADLGEVIQKDSGSDGKDLDRILRDLIDGRVVDPKDIAQFDQAISDWWHNANELGRRFPRKNDEGKFKPVELMDGVYRADRQGFREVWEKVSAAEAGMAGESFKEFWMSRDGRWAYGITRHGDFKIYSRSSQAAKWQKQADIGSDDWVLPNQADLKTTPGVRDLVAAMALRDDLDKFRKIALATILEGVTDIGERGQLERRVINQIDRIGQAVHRNMKRDRQGRQDFRNVMMGRGGPEATPPIRRADDDAFGRGVIPDGPDGVPESVPNAEVLDEPYPSRIEDMPERSAPPRVPDVEVDEEAEEALARQAAQEYVDIYGKPSVRAQRLRPYKDAPEAKDAPEVEEPPKPVNPKNRQHAQAAAANKRSEAEEGLDNIIARSGEFSYYVEYELLEEEDKDYYVATLKRRDTSLDSSDESRDVELSVGQFVITAEHKENKQAFGREIHEMTKGFRDLVKEDVDERAKWGQKNKELTPEEERENIERVARAVTDSPKEAEDFIDAAVSAVAEQEDAEIEARKQAAIDQLVRVQREENDWAAGAALEGLDVDVDKEDDPDEVLHLADAGAAQLPVQRVDKAVDSDRDEFFARDAGVVDGVRDIPVVKSRRVIRPVDNMAAVEISDGREPDNFGIRRNVRVWRMKEKHGGGTYVLDMHPDGYGRLWYYGKDGQEVLLDDRINVNAHSANSHGLHVEEIIDRHVDDRYDPDLNMRERSPIAEDPDDLLLHLADEGAVQIPARQADKVLDDERGGFFAREMGFVDDAEEDDMRRVYTLVHFDEKGKRTVVAAEEVTPETYGGVDATMVQRAKEHNEAAKGAGRFFGLGYGPGREDADADRLLPSRLNQPLQMRDMDGNEWKIEFGNPYTNEQGEYRQPVRVQKATPAGQASVPVETDIAWYDDDAKLSLEQDRIRKVLEARVREEQMLTRLGDVDQDILEEIVAGDVVESPYGRGDRIIGKGRDGKYRYLLRYGSYTDKDGHEVELYARIDFWWDEDVERKNALREDLKKLEPGTEAYDKKLQEIEEVPPRIFAKENDKTQWVRDPLEHHEHMGKWAAQIKDSEGRANRNPDMRPGAAAHKLPKVKGDIDEETGTDFVPRIQERRALQELGLDEDPLVVEQGWFAVQDAINRKGVLEYQDRNVDKVTDVKVLMVEIDSNVWDPENERWARIRVPHVVMRAVVKTSAQDRVEMQYTIDHTGYMRARKWDPQFPHGSVLKLDGKDFYSTEEVWDARDGFKTDDFKVMQKFKNDRAKGIAARDIKPPKDKGPANEAKLLKDGGWKEIGKDTYKKDNFILKKSGMGWRVRRTNRDEVIAGGNTLEEALERLDNNPVWKDRNKDEPDRLDDLEGPDEAELRAIEREGIDPDADIPLGPDLDEVEDAVSHEGLPDPVAGNPLRMERQYHPNLNNRAAWRVIQDVALHEVSLADDPDARGLYVWYDARENMDGDQKAIGWRYGPNKPDDIPGTMVVGYVHPYNKEEGPKVALRSVLFDVNGKRLGADYPPQWVDPDGNKEIGVEHVNEKFSEVKGFDFPIEWHRDPDEVKKQMDMWDALVDKWRKADADYQKSVERKYADPAEIERDRVDVARINTRSNMEFYNQRESWDAWDPTGPDIFDGAPEGVRVGFDGRRYYVNTGPEADIENQDVPDRIYYTDRKPSAAWVQRRIDYDRGNKAGAPHLLDVLDVGEHDEGRRNYRAGAVDAVFGTSAFMNLREQGLAGQLPDGRMAVRREVFEQAVADDPNWMVDGPFVVMTRGQVKDQFDDLMMDLRADMGAQFGVDDQFDGRLGLIDGRVLVDGDFVIFNEGPAGSRNVAGVGGDPYNGSLSMTLDVDSLVEQPWWQDPKTRRLHLNRVLSHELAHVASNKDGIAMHKGASKPELLGFEEGLVEGMSASMLSDIAKRHGWSSDFTPRTTTGLLNDMMGNDPDKASPYWSYLQNLEYVRDRLGMDHKSFYRGLANVSIGERRSFLKRMVLSDDVPGGEALLKDIDRIEALMDHRLQPVMWINVQLPEMHLWDADMGGWRSMAEVNNRHRELIELLHRVPDDHPNPEIRGAGALIQGRGPYSQLDPIFPPTPFQDAHTPRRQGFSEFQFPGGYITPEKVEAERERVERVTKSLFGNREKENLQVQLGNGVSVQRLEDEGFLEAAKAAFGLDGMSAEDELYVQNAFLGKGRLRIEKVNDTRYNFRLHSQPGDRDSGDPTEGANWLEFGLRKRDDGGFDMEDAAINVERDNPADKPKGFGGRWVNFNGENRMEKAGIHRLVGMTSGPNGGVHWWTGDNHHRGLHGDILEDTRLKQKATQHYTRLQALTHPGNKGNKARNKARNLLNGRDDFWINEQRDAIDKLTPELVPEIREAHDRWMLEINKMIFGDGDDAIVKMDGDVVNMRMELLAKIVKEVPEDLAQLIADAGGDPKDFTFRGIDLFDGEDEIPIFQDWIT